jgi:hypothetical protein
MIWAQVHNVDGRLGAVVRLLRHNGFNNVVVRQQSSVVSSSGFASFIPETLELYFVYARRDWTLP